MKEIVKFKVVVKIGKTFRTSPAYDSAEEACATIPAFVNHFKQKYTQVTIMRDVSYVAE